MKNTDGFPGARSAERRANSKIWTCLIVRKGVDGEDVWFHEPEMIISK